MIVEIIVACISGVTAIICAFLAKNVSKVKKDMTETHEHVVNHHGSKIMRVDQDEKHGEQMFMLTRIDAKLDRHEARLDRHDAKLALLEELEITNPRKRKQK